VKLENFVIDPIRNILKNIANIVILAAVRLRLILVKAGQEWCMKLMKNAEK
jgi:hypothetical protein